MKSEKIFVYDKSTANSISLLLLTFFLFAFAALAYYFTAIGDTNFGDIIAIICIILGLVSGYFGVKYFFKETQIWVEGSFLVIKDRFGNSAEDRYPEEAIESLNLRKEIQEMVNSYLLISFTTKIKPWSLSLKPKDTAFGQRILLYRGHKDKVKELTESILSHFKWPLVEDTSEPSIE
ncbi:MAG: hypothetical protein HeimC3_42620 [Candidatus Heimdallarchaeota archaeon LC_3]|nr:MAG: hypothetical protein HeimC3_42620 [Candidatus Heimdallarchaeota archaeon LC_3]